MTRSSRLFADRTDAFDFKPLPPFHPTLERTSLPQAKRSASPWWVAAFLVATALGSFLATC